MRGNVCVPHNMDLEEDAANVNNTPAEVPCQQHGQNVHGSEAGRPYTDPEDHGRPFINIQDLSVQPLTDRSETLQLEFQDSQLSPALTLLPCQDKSHLLSDSTFFQHTDAEFVPLRGFPDLSVVSERCPRISHVAVTDASHLQNTIYEQATLSQHPLEVPAALSEGEKSCCSLSQHSLSPGDYSKGLEDQQSVSYGAMDKINRQMEGEEQTTAQHLSEGMSAPALPLEYRKEDVIVAVSSSSAVSSASNTQNTEKSQLDPSMNLQTGREQPQGGSLSLSSSFQKAAGSVVGSDVSNITFREPQMHGHLYDQLLSGGQRGSISAPASKNHSGIKSGLCVTPAGIGLMQAPGVQRALWSSGHLTATDGSFLTSQPVSQSTPAVPLMRPQPALTKLIYSKQEAFAFVAASAQNSQSKTGLIPSLDLSVQHSSPVCSETTATAFGELSETAQLMSHAVLTCPPHALNRSTSDALHSDTQPSGTEMKDQFPSFALGRVQSLPSLSFLQKVDAWKANQSSSRSFYDNLDLQGFDGESPKKKSQDTMSEALKHMLSRDTRQAYCANANFQVTQPLSSSHSGSGSPRRVDVVGASACRGQASESPVNRSHSHSSLSSVVTSIQRDTGTHSQQVPASQSDDVIPATRSLDSRSSLLSCGKGEGGNSSAPHMDKNSIKMSPLLSLGHFSDVSSSLNLSSTLSSSQGSCHGEQSMRSVGAASSVVSLEVDNYAPYWTSRPASPPHTKELNIEDRIPLYLLNLGIDQSPSTILNPFTQRGPIREPEFSPTDLCTIKGSIGTPTKSTQPSEVDSLQKETFSSSSQLSADSSASVTQRISAHEQSQPASDRSIKMIFTRADTQPLHSTLHPSSSLQQSDAPQSDRSFGLPVQLSPEAVPPPGPREQLKEDDDSFVGSGTLHEIRRLLGRADNLVSGRSSLSSSPGSHRLSESDTSLVSLGRNTRGYHDDTSLSAGGNLSLLLTRSSSDSALKGRFSSSQGPQQTERTTTEPAALALRREESLKSRDLCVTPMRAEPEGCSAADPDKAKPTTATSVMHINVPSIPGNLLENQGKAEDAATGSSENSLSHVSAEVGSLSDSSSESSLAARVAKLLQSESPVSMVTSRPSTADPEDSRAREWILMKVSGRRCESLELNAEDRKRIEDIKRELLLNTKNTKWSSDSEGSSQSSVGPGSRGFVGLRNMENHVSDQLQNAIPKPLHTVPFYMPVKQDPGAKVHQITLREQASTRPFTSITIATSRRTPSPQSQPNCPITGIAESDNVSPEHETLEREIHHRRADAKLGTQLRHQPLIIPNVSDSENETEREGEHREEKEREEMTDDNKENAFMNDSKSVQRVPDMHYPVTGNNQILSSAASVSKSHLSHMHVTLSPKPKHLSSPVKYHSSRLSSQNTSKDVPLQRHSFMVSSMTDEHLESIHRISTSNHASSYEHRKPVQGQNAGTVSVHLQTRYPQTFVPSQRLAGTSKTLSVQAATVPALLPYKPHGSAELFYIQQADSELSPGRSDTTVESSHPGSDDALPPHFNIDVFGSRELEDNRITPKHKEGIYSKRANMERVSSVSGNGLPESVATFADPNDRTADEEENFIPLHMEADYSTDVVNLHNSSMQEPKLPLEPLHLPSQPIRKSYRGNKKRQDRTPHDVNMEISSSLDQLWRRFSEKWSVEATRLPDEGEMSLLDRLERLSRLIHNTTPTDQTILQPDSRNGHYDRRSDREDGTTEEGEERERVQVEAAPQQARPEHEESQERVHRCPAERDESRSVSMETSSSLSTVDTERLLRAFGPHRVSSKGLKSSDSLLRLHNTINMQKTGRRKPSTKHAAVSVATSDVSTDDSTVSADSLSSSSTYSHHSQRGVCNSLNSKRSKVKLLSKGVQAGDLEIVINATRRHTRDVGTIFPSPGAFKNVHSPNMFGRGIQSGPTASTAKPTQSLTTLKRDATNKSVRSHYPNGVSWFVSADELRYDGRKENQPQSESAPYLSQAWFEPYSKVRPWRELTREPLREKQNQQEHEKPTESRTATETDISDKPSALVRLSLQEALALHRPEFVSRSRERMKRLGLLVEERRLQAVFSREREELFNCPGPSRPLRSAPVPHKRVVPRREMVQRSKEKYAQLPEVQKRKEEERRRVEYRSYRLNAQLFNKKVTNHVLGKRAPWQ